MLYEDLTERIIAAYYEVYNTLGFGSVEQVYQNAMFKELTRQGLFCDCQKRIEVTYKDELVGYYIPDIIVENKIILELKAWSEVTGEEMAQILNNLKATDMEVGFLMNFGASKPYSRRFENFFDQKGKSF